MNILHSNQFKFFSTMLFLLSLFPISSAATECQLGKPCHLYGSDLVYYSINPSDGPHYLCTLQSTDPNKIIETIILPGGNFSFEGRKMSADISPSFFEINGQFINPIDEGKINFKNATSTEGIVTCTAI